MSAGFAGLPPSASEISAPLGIHPDESVPGTRLALRLSVSDRMQTSCDNAARRQASEAQVRSTTTYRPSRTASRRSRTHGNGVRLVHEAYPRISAKRARNRIHAAAAIAAGTPTATVYTNHAHRRRWPLQLLPRHLIHAPYLLSLDVALQGPLGETRLLGGGVMRAGCARQLTSRLRVLARRRPVKAGDGVRVAQ